MASKFPSNRSKNSRRRHAGRAPKAPAPKAPTPAASAPAPAASAPAPRDNPLYDALPPPLTSLTHVCVSDSRGEHTITGDIPLKMLETPGCEVTVYAGGAPHTCKGAVLASGVSTEMVAAAAEGNPPLQELCRRLPARQDALACVAEQVAARVRPFEIPLAEFLVAVGAARVPLCFIHLTEHGSPRGFVLLSNLPLLVGAGVPPWLAALADSPRRFAGQDCTAAIELLYSASRGVAAPTGQVVVIGADEARPPPVLIEPSAIAALSPGQRQHLCFCVNCPDAPELPGLPGPCLPLALARKAAVSQAVEKNGYQYLLSTAGAQAIYRRLARASKPREPHSEGAVVEISIRDAPATPAEPRPVVGRSFNLQTNAHQESEGVASMAALFTNEVAARLGWRITTDETQFLEVALIPRQRLPAAFAGKGGRPHKFDLEGWSAAMYGLMAELPDGQALLERGFAAALAHFSLLFRSRGYLDMSLALEAARQGAERVADEFEESLSAEFRGDLELREGLAVE